MNDSRNADAAGFGVDPQRLLEHAAELEGLCERARGIVADLREALAGSAQPWGADEVGSSFARAHTAPADQTLRSLEALPGGLGDIATAFSEAASAYRAADEEAAGGISGIGSVG